MGNIVNLVGRRFGMLTVVQRVGKNSSNHVKWACICDCGNTTEATGSNLKCGHTKSCGCLKHKPAKNNIDLTGEVFNRLTVLTDGHSFIGKGKCRVRLWRCKCSCGNEVFSTTGKLRSGHTQSCGCLLSEVAKLNAYKNLAGKKPVAANGTLPPRKDKNGYVRIHDNKHSRACEGFVLEHIKVMTDYLGRDLLPNENVHHKNGVRDDNRIENLELWSRGQPCGQRVVDRINFYTEYLANYSYQFFDGVNTEIIERLQQLFTDVIVRRKQDEIKRLKQSL